MPNTNRPNGRPRGQVSAWLELLAMSAMCAIVFALLVLSLLYTPTFRHRTDEISAASISEQVDYHFGLPSWTFIGGLALLLVVITGLGSLLAKLPQRRLLTFTLTFITIAQLVWICAISLTNYAYPDSNSLMDAAVSVINGETGRFDPEYCAEGGANQECGGIPAPFTYFSWYPFQSGPMLWFVVVFKIFGLNNVLAVQMLNALMITGISAILWRMGVLSGLDHHGLAAFSMLCCTCLPLLMYCAFVYTNIAGFFLVMIGAWLLAESMRAPHSLAAIALTCSAFLAFSLGIVFKSTYIIVLLAALIAGVLAVLRCGRRYWQILLMLPLAWLARLVSSLPTQWLERWSGQSFGAGMPMVSWIMLGLDQPEGMEPGWWGARAIRVYRATAGDATQQSQMAKDYIMQRLQDFLTSPSEGWTFFRDKLVTEWSEPTFMTHVYSQLGASTNQFKGLASYVMNPAGSPVLGFENVSMSAMYLLAFTGLLALIKHTFRIRKEEKAGEAAFSRALLVVAFLGGFLCYVFWEAKGIYTLPFYLLTIPLAARGTQAMITGSCTLARRIRTKLASRTEPLPSSDRTTSSPSADATEQQQGKHPTLVEAQTAQSTTELLESQHAVEQESVSKA